MQDNTRRLYRSSSNKMIAGVCGGIADYLNVDPTAVRVAWVLLSILPFIPGIILYVIAWFVMPKHPAGDVQKPARGPSSATAFMGFFFVAVGALIFLANLDVLDWEEWWDFSWEYVLPLLLIAVGVFFIARPSRVIQEPAAASPASNAAGASSVVGKTLRRSRTDRKVGGICGGLGAYLGIDPSLVRIAFVFFTVWPFGLGAIVYVIMLLVIPEEDPSPAKQS